MAQGYISDAEFGQILVRTNQRARNISFKGDGNGLTCTIPPYCTEEKLRRALEELRPRLRRMMERVEARNIGARFMPNTRIDTEDFHFWLEEARVSRPTMQQKKGQLVCYYPAGMDWDNPNLQSWLLKGVEESLRQHAKVLFPPRLEAFAKARGLSFNSVSIHKTKGRWGSCSSRGNINLSLYLMIVPRHLQDYVMQHELTHLVEMNHSDRFWALLDKAVGGKAIQYRDEMKNFDTSVF